MTGVWSIEVFSGPAWYFKNWTFLYKNSDLIALAPNPFRATVNWSLIVAAPLDPVCTRKVTSRHHCPQLLDSSLTHFVPRITDIWFLPLNVLQGLCVSNP